MSAGEICDTMTEMPAQRISTYEIVNIDSLGQAGENGPGKQGELLAS